MQLDWVLDWALRLAAVALSLITLGSFVNSKAWIARLCDFPRLHIAIATGLVAVAAMLLTRGIEAVLLAVPCGLYCLWHTAKIMPYTALYPTQCDTSTASNLSVAIANIDYANEQFDEVADALRDQDVDLILMIEINDRWLDALLEVRDRFPYRVESIRGSGLGMALWSRVELTDSAIQEVVSERRPSAWATCTLKNGATVKVVGLHPTPPGLSKPDSDERFDSTIRDVELMRVADRICESEALWLVIGDLNDVAWSRTTSLFIGRSGLADPRVGRGFINSYHAQYPLLRYPLDHVFFSPEIKIANFRRFRLPGSDHFGLRADLFVPDEPGAER